MMIFRLWQNTLLDKVRPLFLSGVFLLPSMLPPAEVQLVVLALGIEADVNMWEMATNTGFGEDVLNYCYFPRTSILATLGMNKSSEGVMHFILCTSKVK